MIECVINVSEGTNRSIINALSNASYHSLLDVHSDAFHNRSVFTLHSPDILNDAITLTSRALELLDIRNHQGVHPRFGVVDVVPFVPLGNSDISEASSIAEHFAREISTRFNVPVFLYGKLHTLPEIRKLAFTILKPNFGPHTPHEKFGAIAVGSRKILVAYNFYLRSNDLAHAKTIAKRIRTPFFRTLGLQVGDRVQLSANLVDPLNHGIYDFYNAVVGETEIEAGELVGLAPLEVIEKVPNSLWELLDVSESKSIEYRIASSQ